MDEGNPGRPMITFGPVPSRRLGRSLGINNIPPKVCTYSCVYCQLGRTLTMQVDRQAFYETVEIAQAVQDRIEQTHATGEPIDYLTFVSDGEPTLDINLGQTIQALKPIGIPIAVITSSSLIDQPEVRDALLSADWVSLKMDAVSETAWRKIDRPHGRLRLAEILEGALTFARYYPGHLVTETMLVAGINDTGQCLRETARFLSGLQPEVAYLSIPTRPPAETWVHPPVEQALIRAYEGFSAQAPRVELLIEYEGDAFAATGNAEDDLLSITAVHPMREEAVESLLARDAAGWDTVARLIEVGKLREMEYEGQKYYMRRLH